MTQKKQHCVITDENTTIDVGDEYEYHRPAWSEPSVPSQFPTLYEDENVLVVCKPAGISVIPGDMYLKNTMVNILRERTQNAEMAPMHRLGRGTTGAIIFAKNVATRKFLAKAFRENKIEKYYLALIRGVPTEDRFTVEQPIGLVPYQGFSQKKLLWAASAIGKSAVSHFEVLRRDALKDHTLVKVKIETGRAHQIRIHAAWYGHPLVGDPLYTVGGLPINKHSAPRHSEAADTNSADASSNLPSESSSISPSVRCPVPGDGGYYLHSWKIIFPLPKNIPPNSNQTYESITVVSPPPTQLRIEEQ